MSNDGAVVISNGIMEIAKEVSDFFFPMDSKILWGSVWIFAILSRNLYAQYLASTFMWFDVPLSHALCRLWKGVDSSYCTEIQMISSFYATLIFDSKFFGSFQPNLLTTIICSFCTVITFAYFLDIGACTFVNMFFSVVIGSALGYLRISFFHDMVS